LPCGPKQEDFGRVGFPNRQPYGSLQGSCSDPGWRSGGVYLIWLVPRYALLTAPSGGNASVVPAVGNSPAVSGVGNRDKQSGAPSRIAAEEVPDSATGRLRFWIDSPSRPRAGGCNLHVGIGAHSPLPAPPQPLAVGGGPWLAGSIFLPLGAGSRLVGGAVGCLICSRVWRSDWCHSVSLGRLGPHHELFTAINDHWINPLDVCPEDRQVAGNLVFRPGIQLFSLDHKNELGIFVKDLPQVPVLPVEGRQQTGDVGGQISCHRPFGEEQHRTEIAQRQDRICGLGVLSQKTDHLGLG